MNDNKDNQTETDKQDEQVTEQSSNAQSPYRAVRMMGVAKRKILNTTADVLGYGVGAANVAVVGTARAGQGAFKLFMIPVKHATALGYTGFSAFVVGTGFAFKKIGQGIGFASRLTCGAAKWGYRPFAPAINKVADTVLPPIGQAAKWGAKGILAGINAVSPIVTVPLSYGYQGVKAVAGVVGSALNIVIKPVHEFGKRKFPKTTEQAERFAAFIGDLRPVDAIAYPLAGLYMGIRGAYKVVYGVLDVSARFVGRRIYNNFPKTSQSVLDGYNIARNKLRDTITNLPPEKAFGLVAVMSALAYCVSPIVGGYYTIYASSEAIRSAAILVPKALKVTAGTTTYLCWDQAKQSKGFEKVKKVYDPFADAVGWIRGKLDTVDDFFEKHITVYASAKNALKANKEGKPEPKKYEGKLAKLGSKIIPGYRRADEHQAWMTDYVVSTRVFKLGERGFNASVGGLKSAWNAVAPYHKKMLDASERATANLPSIEAPFNDVASFGQRVWAKRTQVVDSADQAASRVGKAFGLSRAANDVALNDNPVSRPEESPAQSLKDSHTPR